MNRPPRTRAKPKDAPSRGRLVQWASAVCIALVVLFSVRAGADGGVPLSLQVRLLARLGAYDRHFKARAGPVAKILVVSRKGDAESTFEQASLIKAFSETRDIAGVPIHVGDAEFGDAEALAKRCRSERIAILYLTVGLEAELPRLATALANTDILTLGTTARHAENGAVVGFALEEARPRLVINLPRARAQSVDFRAEVLALARLIQ